jgi:hypothetical protein
MREGDDPRDIYWRKSTIGDQIILRERARETRPDIELVVDTVRPKAALRQPESDAFVQQLERRIREVASRSVAHIKRGDGMVVSTTLGDRVRGDKNLGADPILRFLALLDWVDEAKFLELLAERAARAAHHAPPLVTAAPKAQGKVGEGGSAAKATTRGRA